MQLEAIKDIILKLFGSIIIKILDSKLDNPIIILIFDGLVASISLLISIQLRIGLSSLNSSILLFNNIFVFGLVSVSIFIWLKSNNQLLNHVNKLLISVVLSNTIFIPLMYLMCRNNDLPFTTVIINMFVMSCLLIGSRFIYYNFKFKSYTLLIGNNKSIIMFLRSYKNTIIDTLKYIGIINTNPNININNGIEIPVVGNISELPNIIRLIDVSQIIIIDNELSNDDREVLFVLSQQYKFLLVQVYTYANNQITKN